MLVLKQNHTREEKELLLKFIRARRIALRDEMQNLDDCEKQLISSQEDKDQLMFEFDDRQNKTYT